MKRAKVEINGNLWISYGACDNDDVHLVIYPKGKPAYQRWIESNVEDGDARRASAVFPAAFAGVPGAGLSDPSPNASPVIPVQAQVELKTMCQEFAGNDKRKVWRITDEGGGQCFFERVNILTGIVEVREKSACDVKCADEAGKYR
jgi:hypothetical protein